MEWFALKNRKMSFNCFLKRDIKIPPLYKFYVHCLRKCVTCIAINHHYLVIIIGVINTFKTIIIKHFFKWKWKCIMIITLYYVLLLIHVCTHDILLEDH